jgi:hypothetical protein
LRSVPTAAIAYGYYLGNADRWLVVEATRLGALNLDWYSDVGDWVGCNEFITSAASHLSFHNASKDLSFITYGDAGRTGSPNTRVALIARNSYQASTDWGDSITVTPEGLTPPELPAWGAQLARALAVLGLTPLQDGPQWRVLPSPS